jgi:hypothetical protein
LPSNQPNEITGCACPLHRTKLCLIKSGKIDLLGRQDHRNPRPGDFFNEHGALRHPLFKASSQGLHHHTIPGTVLSDIPHCTLEALKRMKSAWQDREQRRQGGYSIGG